MNRYRYVILEEFSSDEDDGLPDLPDLDLAELVVPSPSSELLSCIANILSFDP